MTLTTKTLLAAFLATMLAGSIAASPANDNSLDRSPMAFQDVDDAEAAGYMQVTGCVPGMGYHYANPEHIQDGELHPSEPEVLVYANTSNGLELVAAEYLLPGDESDPAPTLFGQEVHYHGHLDAFALHAWFWEHNPDGVFTDFNPRINGSCNIQGR